MWATKNWTLCVKKANKKTNKKTWIYKGWMVDMGEVMDTRGPKYNQDSLPECMKFSNH